MKYIPRQFIYVRFSIFLLIFGSFFFYGNNVSGDFSYLSQGELVKRFDIPRIWQERISEGFGQNTLAILWNWPQDLLYGLLSKLGFEFSVIQIVLFLLPFVFVGYYSISRFLKFWGFKEWAVEVGSLFYLLNTYTLLLIDGGQLSIALAYSFMPLAFVSFLESISSDLRKKVIAGFIISVLGYSDIRFVYILGGLLALYFTYFWLFRDFGNLRKNLSSFIYTGFVVSLILILLHFYWLLPAILTDFPSLPEGYSNVSQTEALSFANWKHALFVHSPNWHKNVFGHVARIDKFFALIPIIVASGFILHKKVSDKIFFILLGVIGVLLVKGATDPWPEIYKFLFSHIPGMSLFRDSTKFYVLITLAYSFFFSAFVKNASEMLERRKQNVNKFILAVPVSIYLIFLLNPVYFGKMTGTLSRPVYESNYEAVWSALEKDKEFGRVLWIPAQPPLGYTDQNHPSIEIARINNKRPFASGTVGTYETNNFLRESAYMGELFDVFGIKYIAYPYPDVRRGELKPDNIEYYHAFLDQLNNLPWIKKRLTDYPVPVLKTKTLQDRFFMADNTFIVTGTDRIYDELYEVEGFKLFDNVLVFAENEFGIRNIDNDFTGIVNYDSLVTIEGPDEDQFFYDYRKTHFLDIKLPSSPRENGWWKRERGDFLWLRDFLESKYKIEYQEFTKGGGVAVSEGSNELTLDINELQGFGDMLFARVLFSSRGGKIDFYQGDELIRSIKTKIDDPEKVTRKLSGYKGVRDQYFEYDKSEFFTTQVGRLNLEGPDLRIVTEGEINIVNFLATSALDDFSVQNSAFSSRVLPSQYLNWENLTSDDKKNLFSNKSDPVVSYDLISATRYKVKVENLEKPSTLIFSETFDPNWSLNGKKPFKAYSLVNGFSVSENGEYDLYYEPQKYVNYGFAITVISTFIIGGYILIANSKKRLK